MKKKTSSLIAQLIVTGAHLVRASPANHGSNPEPTQFIGLG
jgi:hypothetical protein